MQTIPLIIVASYLIGMLIVGFVIGKLKIKNSQDYMVAGRRMGLFMVAFSLSANNIGGGSTTGLAAKAFGTWGMSAVWYVLTASIAMIPLAYFAPKIRKTMAVTIPVVVGLAIATPIVVNACGGWQAISAKLPGEQLSFTKIGWVPIVGYMFNYFCTFLSGPEMVSRFESAKDEKTAQRASLVSAVLMAAMAIFPTLLGLAALSMKDAIPTLAENGSNAMMAVTSAYAPAAVTGIVSAAIICATMSSADSNLLCMSTMVMNDLYLANRKADQQPLPEKKIITYTRICNVVFALVAMLISMLGVPLVTMNTFAFGIRCAGPFAAYGLGLVVPKATRNSGVISIITGTIGFIFWQILSKGDFYIGILPVVFGCAVGALTFFLVNAIEWKRGVPAAPSAYTVEEAK